MMNLLILAAIGLRVAFVGDPQADSQQELSYVRQSIYTELRERKDLDLVVILGDLVNDKVELLEPSKASLDSLPCPWFCTPGNHDRDFYNDKTTPRDVRTFSEVIGPADTTFSAKGIRFILMNTVFTEGRGGYRGDLSEEQYLWLERTVSSSKEENIVFCCHIPVSEFKDLSRFESIFEGRNLLVMCGHTHYVSRNYSPEGVEQVMAGATCGTFWRGPKMEDGLPYALMNCGSPRGYFVADLKASGKKWYRLDYKCVGREEKGFAYRQGDSLVVNIFGGTSEGRLKGFHHAQMVDPQVAEIIERNHNMTREERRSQRDQVMPMLHSNTPHIWASDKATSAAPGDVIRLKYKDRNMKFRTRMSVR